MVGLTVGLRELNAGRSLININVDSLSPFISVFLYSRDIIVLYTPCPFVLRTYDKLKFFESDSTKQQPLLFFTFRTPKQSTLKTVFEMYLCGLFAPILFLFLFLFNLQLVFHFCN